MSLDVTIMRSGSSDLYETAELGKSKIADSLPLKISKVKDLAEEVIPAVGEQISRGMEDSFFDDRLLDKALDKFKVIEAEENPEDEAIATATEENPEVEAIATAIVAVQEEPAPIEIEPRVIQQIAAAAPRRGWVPGQPLPQNYRTGICGNYICYDLLAILKLVRNFCNQNNKQYTHQAIACFNYETVGDLINNPSLNVLFQRNIEQLDSLVAENVVEYQLCYQDRPNNLIIPANNPNHISCKWKDDFQNRDNLIFLNPYLETAQLTKDVIKGYLKFGAKALNQDGLLVLGWQLERKDRLSTITLDMIKKFARDAKLQFSGLKSGFDFARKTGFRHLKNSDSLSRNLDNPFVENNRSDVFILFSKSNKLGRTNLIAQSILSLKRYELND